MLNQDRQFILPSKVEAYLGTLSRLYTRPEDSLLREIVVNANISIHEGWDYDNWDGGTYGHAVTLIVPEEIYLKSMDNLDDTATRINTDLNKLNNAQDEHISRVFLEAEVPADKKWREESGVYRPRLQNESISSTDLNRIWGNQHVRVFLSHKVEFKNQTSQLKLALARCGIAAFVAHEDIEPTEEWMREIERALFSMDALVALLSPDFHNSQWTDQEIGVGIGRGVPIIAVRLGLDPYGLMGKAQGLSGCEWTQPLPMALKIVQLLHKRLADKSRLFECALAAYGAATSWDDSAWKVKNLLGIFSGLNAGQVEQVLKAYHGNAQNKQSYKGQDELLTLLEKWIGIPYLVHHDGQIKPREH